jgi:hypothetical protein
LPGSGTGSGNDAGLSHWSAHGLRKAGAAIAAENGAKPHQLMSVFGWLSLKQAELYTRAAQQKRIAKGAMACSFGTKTKRECVPPGHKMCPTFCLALDFVAEAPGGGAQGRNRTTDTVIFSHVLYQLSYLGARNSPSGPIRRRLYRGSGRTCLAQEPLRLAST